MKNKRWKSDVLPPFLVMLLVFLVVLLSARCSKDAPAPSPKPVLKRPASFPPMDIPSYNAPSKKRIALGRQLYYDSILGNGGQACASCHWQKQGFTSPRPAGVPPILPHVNLAWKQKYMWQGSKNGPLESVMRFEVQDFMSTDLQRLRDHPRYPALFAEAYGSDSIYLDVVARALAQFVRSLISANSKYDRVMAGKARFTPTERKGWKLFNAPQIACFHCHVPPLFTDNVMHNTGVDTGFGQVLHQGHYAVSGDSAHLGHFLTPTLRNVALRKRYLHDGRFDSLRQVVAFYNNKVKKNPWLDPVMVKASGQTNLKLSPEEVNALTAFLGTLTDTPFTQNPRFSDPQP